MQTVTLTICWVARALRAQTKTSEPELQYASDQARQHATLGHLSIEWCCWTRTGALIAATVSHLAPGPYSTMLQSMAVLVVLWAG